MCRQQAGALDRSKGRQHLLLLLVADKVVHHFGRHLGRAPPTNSALGREIQARLDSRFCFLDSSSRRGLDGANKSGGVTATLHSAGALPSHSKHWVDTQQLLLQQRARVTRNICEMGGPV